MTLPEIYSQLHIIFVKTKQKNENKNSKPKPNKQKRHFHPPPSCQAMQRVNVYSHALPFSPPCLKCLRRSVFGLNIPRIQNCSLSLLTSEGGKLGPGWMRREGGSGRRRGRANHDQNTSYKSYFQFKKLDESRGFHRK